ncbi:MAG TPA: aldo/keto reductase [Candidatus Borkfalkia faecigallinarum]|uniref:Aldo/keto reductase n=1 Tax=Candidatus Borkfalkia faecigallinarum TaxID=2838509 RepID=A0A9D1VUC6_9FIRM|nr:aldo/keto reductase [Candidatus Borkfalkia faecigallinarum]
MREVSIGGARFPAIAVGCMGLNKLDGEGVRAFLSASLDAGLYFFDHADIYGGGECESLFGEAMVRLGVARDAYVLQSKCGIVPGKMYDFSEEHILASVDGSLRRLRTDRLDFLLLHRPDALMRPEEVAAAFDKLAASGKVLRFGVSNMHPYQIELLQSCVRRPICVNQLQFSPAHAGMITAGLEANMRTEGAASHDGYVLDYCRLHGIAIQAWSPLRYGLLEGVYLDDPRFASLNACLARIAGERGVAKSAIVAAWILRHPAAMQVVTGTSNARRLLEMAEGAQIELSRAEWYEIYLSAGNRLP